MRVSSLLLLAALWGAPPPVLAAAGATPVPTATAAPSDPCGGSGRLLATLNRPTVGFSACAAAPKTVLLEVGYQNQETGSDALASRTSQYPQTFVRAGLSRGVELDVIGPNFAGGGAYDSGLGLKYELPPSGKFTVAIDGLYTSPNGSPLLTAGNATLTGNLDIAYALDETTGIGTTLALASTGGYAADGTHARYGVFMPSFVVTKQLPNFYQLYGEYVYASRVAPDAGGRAFVDYGVQKLLGPRFEIDAELGNSLTGNPAMRFHYVGFGFGIALP
ncbi:MAG TPA: hypothetical protein VIG32_05225 [Candidatus Baltobacteraceae bacterium]